MLRVMSENVNLYKDGGVNVNFIGSASNGEDHIVRKIFYFLRAIFLLLREFFKSNVDVVHIHSALKGSLSRKIVFSFICLILRIPYIFHVHNGRFFERYLSENSVRRFFIRRALSGAKRVVVLSQHMRNIAIDSGTVRSDQCALVFNGIADPLSESPPRIRTLNDTTKLVFMGLISVEKGIPVLLDAVEFLTNQGEILDVCLYGEKDLDLEGEVASRNLGKSVTFGGWIGGDDKQFAFEHADIFVLPSRSEGFSVALLEAMAYGLPIVSTSIPGVVDAIRNGVDGLLVPADNASALAHAIRKLTRNSSLRARFGNAARHRYLNNFSVHKMIREVSLIYFDVLNVG